jgi:hypothetical protein
MTDLRPEFVERASTEAIRAQYEYAQARADLWTDRARDLFLLLSQREGQAGTLTGRFTA